MDLKPNSVTQWVESRHFDAPWFDHISFTARIHYYHAETRGVILIYARGIKIVKSKPIHLLNEKKFVFFFSLGRDIAFSDFFGLDSAILNRNTFVI